MVFMNSWNIEQLGAGVGDDFDAKITNSIIRNGYHELLVQ